jgi:hypothetical protein
MDYRKMFSEWHKAQVAENANPYPTGVQGFQGGVEAERARIIALLEARRYDLASCLKDDDCAVRADAIDVCISDIKGEIE